MGKMHNFLVWLGIAEEDEVTEEIIEMPVGSNQDQQRGAANVVSIHANKNLRVIVCEPQSFEEVELLTDHLKNRKQVIINFENTSEELTRKVFDFISGATYALEGNSQQLGRHVFMFAPSNVEISKDARTLLMRNKFAKPFGGGEQ
ncbi:MAG: cell division protein SepF [Syntrophomonadaceae bacterium]|jgi:cell division inhibitor SepF|nr:cell division protein SepF [Syntrophomonadaceae bacterium]